MDATLIRAALVPAFMRLAGDANWWAPAPLRRVYERWGISESEPPPRAGIIAPVEYKVRMLEMADAASGRELRALLRREGLSQSDLDAWRADQEVPS
jgi:hypothetical protein